MSTPTGLPDESAAAYDTTGPSTTSPAAPDDVPESIEDDPGEGLFLDDEPLAADNAPPVEDDFSDVPAEEDDQVQADVDARDARADEARRGPGSSGLDPAHNSFSDRLDVDPERGDTKG